jgi:hypothetical protein
MELKSFGFIRLKKSLLLAGVCLIQACTFLPTAVRDSAESLDRGELSIATDVIPNPTVSAAYGITEQWDVGVELAITPSIWGRYTLPNQKENTAVALTGGVFQAQFRTVDTLFSSNYSEESATGFYLGGIYSHKMESGNKFNLAMRYNSLQYDSFVSDGGVFSDTFLGFGDGNGSDFIVSDKDLSGVVSLSATMSIAVKPQAHISIGASCLFMHTRETSELSSAQCYPVLGATFFRR